MIFKDYLNAIVQGNDLKEAEMQAVMTEILSGNVSDIEIGALMAAMATKKESAAEVTGAARAMRKKAARIQVGSATVVDTVGTGGDCAGTFNISTTTSFVVAGCGLTVAKHGNRSVSSKCGSADVLEALGVKLDTPPEVVEEAVNELGIGFLFAPLYHSAMKYAVPARKALGIRSIFNMLGPLTNPAGANCQLIGVYAPELTEMFADVLKQLGSRRAMVVYGHDGLDEISVCAPTRVSELKDGMISTYDLDPERFFGELAPTEALIGGDAAVNADITRSILKGETGPRRNVVLLNAAASIMVADACADIPEGIAMAEAAIDSGKAMEKLDALIQYTQENG